MSVNAELPNGWIATTLGSVIDYGRTSKVEPDEIPDDAWVLELEDIEKDSSKILKRVKFSERRSKSTKNRFDVGDVLYGKLRPYLNKIVIADAPGYCTTEITPLKPNDVVDGRYLFYWLKHPSFLEYVTGVSHGLNMPRLGTEAGKNAPLVLAPLAEQKRIADKLDRLLAAVDTCKASLDAIPAILKRFRQSVLAAATSGALTEEWRKTFGANYDWSTVNLDSVASDFSYGSAAKSQPEGELPVLRMGNIQEGKLVWDDLVYTSDPSEIRKYRLIAGDVLFNRTNSPELVGKTAVFRGEQQAIYAGYLIRVQCKSNLLPDYLNYCLNSPNGREYCRRVKTDGVSQSNINARKLAEFSFSLPSLEEQHEIVQRVNALDAYVKDLQTRHSATIEKVERLKNQLLAKAFVGDLVPQNPTDEPARVLLERIKVEQRSAAHGVRGRTQVVVTPVGRITFTTSPATVKGGGQGMSRVTAESVASAIRATGARSLTFEELRKVVPSDYESIREALFELLSDPISGVFQRFDVEARQMIICTDRP